MQNTKSKDKQMMLELFADITHLQMWEALLTILKDF